MAVDETGKGRPLADATSLTVRLQPEHLAAIDAWIAEQAPEGISRPEAMRRLAADALKRMGYLATEKQLGRR